MYSSDVSKWISLLYTWVILNFIKDVYTQKNNKEISVGLALVFFSYVYDNRWKWVPAHKRKRKYNYRKLKWHSIKRRRNTIYWNQIFRKTGKPHHITLCYRPDKWLNNNVVTYSTWTKYDFFDVRILSWPDTIFY